MAQLSANALQIVPAGQSAVFTNTFITPQEFGVILPRPDNNGLYLRGTIGRCTPKCWRDFFAEFYASFSANVQIPTGGTVEEISLAISQDGQPLPSGIMIVNPAAVEEFDNVSVQVFVPVPRGGIETITVDNTSTQDIGLQNANLTVFMPGILR